MSPLAIAPTAQKRGIKKLLCIPLLAEWKKLDINFICELLRNSEPLFAFPKNWIWICPTLWFNFEIFTRRSWKSAGGQGFLRSETRQRRGERATNRLWFFKMSELVAIAERSSNLFWTKLRLIAALRAAETERSGGQKGRGLGGRNFCPPSLGARPPLADSDFPAAAEFRTSETGAPPKIQF